MMMFLPRIQSLVMFLSLASFGNAFTATPLHSTTTISRIQSTTTSLRMAVDYNDPVVAEEFAKVQPMDYDDVVDELRQTGVAVSASMNDMEIKLMLVEMRLRLSGKMNGKDAKKKPTKFNSRFEELMWTKPAFAELFEELKAKGDHNSQNVATEYVNDPVVGRSRYGKTYKGLIRKIDEAMTAPPPVKSPKLRFSGFPANMGEDACRMTLEALGPVVSFSCAPDEDFPILKGEVTYDDIETAKKAVAQYAGMDMGMGQAIEMVSVAA